MALTLPRLQAGAARRLWPWIAALVVAALTASLGLWQLDRAAQKQALHAAIQTRGAEPALGADELARDAAAAAAQQHRRARVQGRWDAARTVYLENRPMAGRVGFYAVTPLLLDDGSALLVQRGWIARDLLDRTRIAAPPAPAGRVSVAGRLALSPARLYEFDAAASGPIRQNLKVAAFAAETGLRLRPLVLIQEDEAAAPGPGAVGGAAVAGAVGSDGLRREWPVPASGVAKHHGYAFQWFGLSALSLALVLWFQVLRPMRRGDAAAAADAAQPAVPGVAAAAPAADVPGPGRRTDPVDPPTAPPPPPPP